jgi:Co/Zn/Cd efflux system component
LGRLALVVEDETQEPAVGFAALFANAASFGLLWAYREGDANMRSAWICTRNDVLGNLGCLDANMSHCSSNLS